MGARRGGGATLQAAGAGRKSTWGLQGMHGRHASLLPGHGYMLADEGAAETWAPSFFPPHPTPPHPTPPHPTPHHATPAHATPPSSAPRAGWARAAATFRCNHPQCPPAGAWRHHTLNVRCKDGGWGSGLGVGGGWAYPVPHPVKPAAHLLTSPATASATPSTPRALTLTAPHHIYTTTGLTS
jgi:hypothetical protein